MGGRAVETLFKYAKRVPLLRDRIEAEYEKVLEDMRASMRPYKDDVPRHVKLPSKGRAREELLEEMRALKAREEDRWQDGFVSGAVYHGDPEHVAFLDAVYALNSQTNPLHADLWPRIAKYEGEVIAMTARMLGGDRVTRATDEVCGTVTSGGTESIMLAMKTYRDFAEAERGVTSPNLVMPLTAHAAFDKACESFKIRPIKIPMTEDTTASVAEARKAVGRNTIAVVGSAPAFPHGCIDPIAELSELAYARGVGFHTDACLGGFVLPFAEKLGYPVPPFDFRLRGVTSMSADTHKYGYAAKGTSVVLYRNRALRRHQFFRATDWPGGLYASPTFAGSRPGALSAACWAAMVAMGEDGYLEATRRILETADSIKHGIRRIRGLKILGEPLWVIAFASDEIDIYRVLDFMGQRHWNLNGLHKPPSVHLCVTLRHTQPGVAERFLSDLRAAVEHARSEPKGEGGMAPVYGLANKMPVRTAVGDILAAYLDVLYEA
ncbi:MAG: aminotransferase class V-fold PLP-dependent enzyme [Nannocystaceae bacterium]|nr:aminotransferase class V-fold PLP-dependent enzyme [bacterium]